MSYIINNTVLHRGHADSYQDEIRHQDVNNKDDIRQRINNDINPNPQSVFGSQVTKSKTVCCLEIYWSYSFHITHSTFGLI